MDPITVGIFASIFGAGYALNRKGKTPRQSAPTGFQPGQNQQEVFSASSSTGPSMNEMQEPVHNNMQPSFGSNPSIANLNQEWRHLEIDTNTNDVSYRSKKEIGSLFEPQPQYSKQIPSYLTERYELGSERRFETPVESFRDIPMDPRNRLMPENENVYRRTQLEGDVIMGKNSVDAPTQSSEVRYNNAHKFHINTNESFLPTSGPAQRETVRSSFEMDPTERSHYATAGYHGNPGNAVDGTYFRTQNQGEMKPTSRGACGTEQTLNVHSSHTQGAYGQTHIELPGTEREITNMFQYDNNTGITGHTSQGHRYNDNLRTTGRETVIPNSQTSYGFMTGHSQPMLNDKTELEHTQRDVINGQSAGKIWSNPGSRVNGAVVNTYQETRTTGRETLSQVNPTNVGSAYFKANTNYTSMMNAEGGELRTVTDGNRASNGQSMNNPLGSQDVMRNVELKEVVQTTHTPAAEKVYGNEPVPPQNVDVNPNKIDAPIETFDPEVLQQLRCNDLDISLTPAK